MGAASGSLNVHVLECRVKVGLTASSQTGGGGGDPDLIHLLNKKTHYTSDIWAAVRITSSQRCSTQTPTFIGTQQQQQDAPNAVPPFSAIFPTLNDQNLLNVTLL